jgi:hypothetical protein
MRDEGSDIDPTLLAFKEKQRRIYPDRVTLYRDPEDHIIEEHSYHNPSKSKRGRPQVEWDAKVASDVVMFYRAGASLKDLAKMLGTTYQWLSKYLKELEIARRVAFGRGEEGDCRLLLKDLLPPYPIDVGHIASDALFSMGHSVEMEPEIDHLKSLYDRMEERRIQQEEDSFMILTIHRRRRYGTKGYPDPFEEIYQDLGRRVEGRRKV